MASRPTTAIDYFSDEVLTNPYPFYAETQAAGGVVWMEKYGVWAITKFDLIRKALLNWETFSSDKAIAIAPEFNAMLGINIIGSDPPVHNIMRKAMAERISPKAIRGWREDIEKAADALVSGLAKKGSFDAVADLAQPFPLGIVSDLIGLPKEGREEILKIARASFNVTGPMNERAILSGNVITEGMAWVAGHALPEHLTPGGLGMSVYEAVANGKLPEEYGMPIVLAYLFPAMDTTINAIGHAVWLFGQNPDQWQALRADPSLVSSAFEEVLRIESPVLGFARKTMHDTELGGVQIRKGEQIYLMYGGGNRDETKYPQADRFDIKRNPTDNVTFGYGIHMCVGQGLARAEGRAVLTAMVKHFKEIHVGDHKRVLSNGVRGLEALPTTVIAA